MVGLWIFLANIWEKRWSDFGLAPLTIPAAKSSAPVLQLGRQLLPRGRARYRAHTPLVG